MEDLLKTKFGSIDLPQYHPKYDGLARTRFTYLMKLMHQTKIDEEYHWPILKYDADFKKVVG